MDLESRDNRKKMGPKRLLNSFKYAIEGFFYTVKNEQNMVIHLLVTMIVIVGGIFFKISLLEWLVCLLFIGLVIGTELLNTAIEAAIDLTCPDKNSLAKVAKDTAAAAVMVFALAALIAGIIIFLPRIIELLK